MSAGDRKPKAGWDCYAALGRIADALERIATALEPTIPFDTNPVPSICFHEDECTEGNCPCDGDAR